MVFSANSDDYQWVAKSIQLFYLGFQVKKAVLIFMVSPDFFLPDPYARGA
jgi:hypothetical protein